MKIARMVSRLRRTSVLSPLYAIKRRSVLLAQSDAPRGDRERLMSISAKPSSKYAVPSFENSKPTLDLSIIVPASNVDKYISDCLGSLLNQGTGISLEVLVVNDGSTDSTLDLIKECQKEDPRIVLIDQENKGFSGARNVALDKSRGRAICFLDSDDMFEDGFLDLMYDGYVKSRSDYVTGQFTKMSEDGKIQGRQKGKRSHGGPCSRIYDRRIWESIRFPVDYWFEDTLLSIVLPRYKGSYIEAAGYLRRNRADSITHTASYEKKGLDTYWIIEEMLEWNRLLGFSVDQVIYDWLIVQMGPLMLSRTKALSDSDLKNLFYVCCDLFSSEVDGSLLSTSLSGKWLDIELALRSRNFDLWALSCAWL